MASMRQRVQEGFSIDISPRSAGMLSNARIPLRMAAKKTKSSRARSARKRAAPSERLLPGESALVLEKLLAAHPELRKEVNAVAIELAKASPFEATAESLADDLRGLDLDELNNHAGDHGDGYVDPSEAGYEACQEMLDPLLEEMDRQIELGLEADALETLKGIVLGLYMARNDKGDGCLAWAPDFPSDAAERAVSRWRDARSRTPAARSLAQKSLKVLVKFVAEHAPEWNGRIERVAANLRRKSV